MPERAYIAIGSNLGDRHAYLEAGLKEVAALPNTRLAEVSRAYETPPLGPVSQPDFLNAVFAIETSLAPEPLLAALLAAEKKHQRQRRIHWGAAHPRPRPTALRRARRRKRRFDPAAPAHARAQLRASAPLRNRPAPSAIRSPARPFAAYLAALNGREAKSVAPLILP